jgi:hypothetical protein
MLACCLALPARALANAAAAPMPTSAAVPAATTAIPPAEAIAAPDLERLQRTGTLEQLDLACRQLAQTGDTLGLRQLRQRLMTIHPAPQPLAVVLANAGVLLNCRMPDGALSVLDRISPNRGPEQVEWLTLQWRAANAALDHRRAAMALERLALQNPARLEDLLVPLQQRRDGSWLSRSALELLASHLESAGLGTRAGSLLLLSRNQDAPAAERLARAVRLLAELPPAEREPLFERALEQAAAAGSWGLVGELLTVQAVLPASPEAAMRTAERRLRLSRRLDDAYGEWRALQDSGTDPARLEALGRQLRSPQAPGGHAAPASGAEPMPAAATPPAGGSPIPQGRPPG